MTSLAENSDPFSEAVSKLWDLMNPCMLCPRKCKVNRSPRRFASPAPASPDANRGGGQKRSSGGEIGFCGIGDMPVVSSVGPHFGEESVLVGHGGSGTIFFAGCNLGCVFCQNYDISHQRSGREVTIEELAQSMLELQSIGCSNINFVTPTHVVPAIAAALELARRKGLVLPTVYNSGGYDSVETLTMLDGFMDIYMPDMKYSDSAVAKELSGAADYPQVNREAVKEMHRQVGDLQIEKSFTAKNAETHSTSSGQAAEEKQKVISAHSATSAVKIKGLAIRGLLVRHLVLPENLAGSFGIIDFLAEEVSPKTAINVMDQYRPCFKAHLHAKINRKPTFEEIEAVRQYAIEKGLGVIR